MHDLLVHLSIGWKIEVHPPRTMTTSVLQCSLAILMFSSVLVAINYQESVLFLLSIEMQQPVLVFFGCHPTVDSAPQTNIRLHMKRSSNTFLKISTRSCQLTVETVTIHLQSLHGRMTPLSVTYRGRYPEFVGTSSIRAAARSPDGNRRRSAVEGKGLTVP